MKVKVNSGSSGVCNSIHVEKAKFTAEINEKNSTEVNGSTITDVSNGAWLHIENVSVIFILETYTHSVAKKYKGSQPKAVLHIRNMRKG